MLTRDNKDTFLRIARELYTKEYLGTDGYGIDKEYEDELTEASAAYLISIFKNPSETRGAKDNLLHVMEKHQPQHQSTLLKIIL
jgi:hypothetical protein